jgi:hypothetical protein
MIPITVERLGDLYDNVSRRSLRLETRQTYHVPWEDEGRSAWRRGDREPPPDPELDEFRARLAARRARGLRTVRVRFVELPMTEYSAQEFTWGYPRNTSAGEEILVVDRAGHPEFDHVVEDFAVFDDTALMYYRYTSDDQLTGYEFSDDPALVAEHLHLAEEVLSVATPFPRWAREHV